MKVIRTRPFDRTVGRCGLSEADIARLAAMLVDHPEAGVVIPRSGGLRKVRFAFGGKGKRGGARIIYVVLRHKDRIYLLAAYRKARTEDLSHDQLQRLRQLVEGLK